MYNKSKMPYFFCAFGVVIMNNNNNNNNDNFSNMDCVEVIVYLDTKE